MTGPLYRFLAMHRWWGLLLLAAVLLALQISAFGLTVGERALITAILVLIVWVPLTALMVLVPRLRGLVVAPVVLAWLFQVADLEAHFGALAIYIPVLVIALVFLAMTMIWVSIRLKAQLRIDHPIEDLARLMRYHETTQHWHSMLDRVERHPENPEMWRCFLASPYSKAVTHYDVEVVENLANGGFVARIQGQIGKRPFVSMIRRELKQTPDGTVIYSQEDSRVNLLSVLLFWLDRLALDHLHQLRFYVEGATDWTINAGAGRWWPTWRPTPPSAAF